MLPLAVGQHGALLPAAEKQGLRGLLRAAALQLRKHDAQQKGRVQTADLTLGTAVGQESLQEGQILLGDDQHGSGQQPAEAGRQPGPAQNGRSVPRGDGLGIQIGVRAIDDLPPFDAQHAKAADRIRRGIRSAGLQAQYQIVLQPPKLVKGGKTGEAEHLCSLPFSLSHAGSARLPSARSRGKPRADSFFPLYRIAAPGSITEISAGGEKRGRADRLFLCTIAIRGLKSGRFSRKIEIVLPLVIPSRLG